MPCPNQCGQQVVRSDMQTHFESCALATSKCFCGATVKRVDLAPHMSDGKHLGDHLQALWRSSMQLESKLKEVVADRQTLWSKLHPHPGVYVVTAKLFNPAKLRVGDLVDAEDGMGHYLSRLIFKNRTHVRVHYLGYDGADKMLTYSQLAPAYSHTFLTPFAEVPRRLDLADFDPVRNFLQFDYDSSARHFQLQRTHFHTEGGWSCCLQQDRDAKSCALDELPALR